MHPFSALRSAAAIFFIATAGLTTTPASAAVPTPAEASYVRVLRSLNPHLSLAKARAYAHSVMANAWRTHLDPRFIMSIVTVESRWRANAVSRVGARGLGQLMPATAATLGVNAWNPADNLHGTSSYLRLLLDHFAGKKNALTLAIAGYNAGPKAVERYHGVPPYSETQTYVVRVMHVWHLLNARVGRVFAPAAPEAIAARVKTPEERQWVTSTEAIINPAVPPVDIPVDLPVTTPGSSDATTTTSPASTNAPDTAATSSSPSK